MLTTDLINEARERISARIHRTPVITSSQFDEVAGKEVFFKCENLQRAGAFKIRGATNKIRSLTELYYCATKALICRVALRRRGMCATMMCFLH